MIFGRDLAFIHHAGFSGFAESASAGILPLLEGVEGLVVDIGCGSGVLARELTRAGHEVLGIDPSSEMIELARTTAPLARFEIGSLGDPLPPCDAITAIGEVFNYAGFDAMRTLIATTTARVLIFDVAIRDAYPAYEENRTGGEDWSVIAIKESDGRIVTHRLLTFRLIDGESVRSEEVHTLELFDREDLVSLLSGFEVSIGTPYEVPEGHAVFGVRRP